MVITQEGLDFISGDIFSIKDNSIDFSLKEEGLGVSHNFCFKVCEIPKETILKISINNACKSQFQTGWKNYLPYFSEDGINFQRAPESSYENGIFSFVVKPKSAEITICYYPPYSFQKLISFLKVNAIEQWYLPDKTTPFVYLNANTKKTIVFLNRQHPGEFQGSYFLEGLIKKYLEISKKDFNLLIFPIVNMLGLSISNHRYTEKGEDLNRIWGRSITLGLIEAEINKCEDISFIFDVHGDEVSKIDYMVVNSKSKLIKTVHSFTQIVKAHKIKRFFRALIKQRIILTKFGNLAFEYFEKKFKKPSFTIELSSHTNSPSDCYKKGKVFFTEINKF